MKKTLSTLRAILPQLTLVTIIFVPFIAHGQSFVPLNPIPGIIEAGNSPSLPAFFNGLYKICIGAAATIAVLQIMRAGFMFMVNKGSVSHNEEAKSIITNSVLGLVLVLSPAIVFGIINPKILNLDLNVSNLQPTITANSFSTTTLSKQDSCTIYSAVAPKRVAGESPSNITCDANWTKAPNTCCSLSFTDEICCAQVAKSQYLLGYHYTRHEANGNVCRSEVIKYDADAAKCKEDLDFAASTTIKFPRQGETNSAFTVDKACVLVNNTTYKLAPDPKLPTCQ